jgi:hypothetical protein
MPNRTALQLRNRAARSTLAGCAIRKSYAANPPSFFLITRRLSLLLIAWPQSGDWHAAIRIAVIARDLMKPPRQAQLSVRLGCPYFNMHSNVFVVESLRAPALTDRPPYHISLQDLDGLRDNGWSLVHLEESPTGASDARLRRRSAVVVVGLTGNEPVQVRQLLLSKSIRSRNVLSTNIVPCCMLPASPPCTMDRFVNCRRHQTYDGRS